MTADLTGNRTTSIFKALFFCLAFTGLLACLSPLKHLLPLRFERLAYGIIGTIAALVITWLFLRAEKKSFKEAGLHWEAKTLQRFLLGLVIGLCLSTVMVLSLVSLANLKLEPVENGNVAGFLLWSLALVPLAYMEEAAFRAYPFMHLQLATGIWAAQISIAALFALYHVAGGQSWFSACLGPGVWSFVFGLAMIMSRGIALPTGLHLGVNFILAAIGQQTGFASLWNIQYKPPNLFVGTTILNLLVNRFIGLGQVEPKNR